MRAVRGLAAALACGLVCHAAQADRSRIGEDSDALDTGDCELETTVERTKARGGIAERQSAIQLNCGVGWRSELAAAFATSRSNEPRVDGLAIEGRTTLRERRDGAFGASIAYGVQAERSVASSWRRNGQFVELELTRQLGTVWFFDARLGTARDRPSRRDSTLWSLAVEHSLTEAFEMRVEVGGDDRQRPLWVAGLRYAFWPDRALISLDYGARAGAERERRWSLGVTVEF